MAYLKEEKNTRKAGLNCVLFYLRDMAQLVDRVRCVKHLKFEKARSNRNHKKERVPYIEVEEREQEISNDSLALEEGEVNLDELKQRPSYPCKMMTPSNGKNPLEPEKAICFLRKHIPSM